MHAVTKQVSFPTKISPHPQRLAGICCKLLNQIVIYYTTLMSCSSSKKFQPVSTYALICSSQASFLHRRKGLAWLSPCDQGAWRELEHRRVSSKRKRHSINRGILAQRQWSHGLRKGGYFEYLRKLNRWVKTQIFTTDEWSKVPYPLDWGLSRYLDCVS